MHKFIASISMLAVMAAAIPGMAGAQTSSTTIQAQLTMLAQLQAQVNTLLAQLQEVQTKKQAVVAQLVSNLKEGSQGDQVSVLQALLAADPQIYPEGLISGYYGRLTSQAVRKFQQKNGLPTVGVVGPQTRAKLNSLFKDTKFGFESEAGATATTSTAPGLGVGRKWCVIVPPGHLIAPGWLRKHDGVKPIVPECQKLHPGTIPKLGTTTTSTPDVTAPIISSVSATTSVNSATITWTTNELATSQVVYGATSSYGSSTALNATRTLSHSMVITGLTSGTVYNFQVQSKDAANNLATSSNMTFTTLVADVTAPVISGVSATTTTSTANVVWTTNEGSDSQVFYGLTTAYGSSTVLNPALVTSHAQGLTGLMPGTVYHFMVQSKDSSGNTATSSDMTFTTVSVDTTAPSISSISVTPASTTAAVSWNTNEGSTSKVYYGTTTPLVLASASTTSNMTLVTSHAVNLTGLNASTTYYFVVESADASSNTATSSEQSFVTSM